uniref:Nucleoporin NDC1 n=1 Tax=Biomphalaria glabrata TaxID=6526 RepID=A0A2C9M602_BIOGL
MVSLTNNWFQSEVLFWRSLASLIWSGLLVPIFILLFVSLSGLSIIHPLQWLYDSLTVPFGSSFWLTTFVVATCLLLISWFSLSHFSVVADVNATPLNAFAALFCWSRLPLLTVSLLCGAVTTWSLTRILGSQYKSFTQVKIIDRKFKLFHIRSDALDLLLSCTWQSFQVVKYYFIFYLLFGELFKSWISNSFTIVINTEVIQLNSFLGLLNFNLMWQTYLCTFFILFSWSIARAIIRIFLKDQMEFLISPVLEKDKDHTLPTALVCSASPLLQHLAFLDLSQLARFSSSRRQELVSLSQPGGHPRTWVAVGSSALGIINELIESVKEENWSILSKVKSQGQCSNEPTVSASKESFGVDLNVSLHVSKLFSSMSSVPVISYLVTEYPDVISRSIFASCQLQIWAVEGISHLASRAINEDKYGVVQSYLPTVFCTLLDLYEVTEKHFKLTSCVLRKYNGSSGSLPDALLRFKLHFTTKTALYRLVGTYKQYLEDLRLHQDYYKKLQPFIDYLV